MDAVWTSATSCPTSVLENVETNGRKEVGRYGENSAAGRNKPSRAEGDSAVNIVLTRLLVEARDALAGIELPISSYVGDKQRNVALRKHPVGALSLTNLRAHMSAEADMCMW